MLSSSSAHTGAHMSSLVPLSAKIKNAQFAPSLRKLPGGPRLPSSAAGSVAVSTGSVFILKSHSFPFYCQTFQILPGAPHLVTMITCPDYFIKFLFIERLVNAR